MIWIVEVFDARTASVAEQRFQPGIERLLHVEVFDHRFDRPDRPGPVRRRTSVALQQRSKADGPLDVGPFGLLVVRDFFQHVAHAVGQRRLGGVGHGDRQSAGCRLAAAMPAPMMPAPIDADRADSAAARRRSGRRPVFFVVVGEEEDIDQGPIDRRAEQAGHPFGLLIAGRVERRPAAPSITSSAASGAG